MKHLYLVLIWWKGALFPHKCLVCRKEGIVLCSAHSDLPTAVLPPLSAFPELDGLYGVTSYTEPSGKALVHWLKFYRHRAPVEVMVEHLQERIPWDQWPFATIVPLPLHWWRGHQRGFNQSALLARGVAGFWEMALNEKDFKRVKITEQQARLSKLERQKNMQGAFAWKGVNPPPKTVILLDDVCTTGASLQAAAKALKYAGAKRVIGVVFCVSILRLERLYLHLYLWYNELICLILNSTSCALVL